MIVRARFREQECVPGRTPSPEARALALVYAVEAAVERGDYWSAAEVARALGVSRARFSQLMRRRWIPVKKQEAAIRGHEHSCLAP